MSVISTIGRIENQRKLIFSTKFIQTTVNQLNGKDSYTMTIKEKQIQNIRKYILHCNK